MILTHQITWPGPTGQRVPPSKIFPISWQHCTSKPCTRRTRCKAHLAAGKWSWDSLPSFSKRKPTPMLSPPAGLETLHFAEECSKTRSSCMAKLPWESTAGMTDLRSHFSNPRGHRRHRRPMWSPTPGRLQPKLDTHAYFMGDHSSCYHG